MHEFVTSLVTLPEPVHMAILGAVTLVLGLLISQLAQLWPALAERLGEYVDEAAVVVAGAIVSWLNGYLAQIPANWEGVAMAALNLLVAVLVAIGVINQVRKAREAIAIRALDKMIEEL